MVATQELKKKDFSEALSTLERALEQDKDEFLRDSVIKRFEYCFEVGWKTAKLYLSEQYGQQVFSPKEVFRQLRIQGMLSDEDTETALRMTDDRNKVIHIYEKEFSEEMYDKIASRYFPLLQKLYEAMT